MVSTYRDRSSLTALGTSAVATAILWALSNSVQTPEQSTPAAGTPLPSFEVASVKRSNLNENTSFHALPNRLTITNMLMEMIIELAYGRDFGDFGFLELRKDRLVGGPRWIRGGEFGYEGYDIDAMVDDSLAEKFGKECSLPAFGHGRCDYRRPMMLMLQSLLADRFKLRVHRESKQGPVFGLVMAEGGSKLPACTLHFSPSDSTAVPPSPPHCPAGMSCVEGCMPISLLTARLNFGLSAGRPVIDQTGLTGPFNVKLQFARMGSPSPLGPVGPSLFKAIQDQLGLKLKPTKAPVETLVIDHIERPSEN